MRVADNTNIKLNVEDAKRSAKFIHSMFKDLCIKYWMDYGTLLGIVRDKKFISYDTDIEFYIFFKNEDDKIRIFHEIGKRGFGCSANFDTRQGITIQDKKGYIHMSFGWFKYHPILSRLSRLVPMRLYLYLGRRYTHSTNKFIRPHEGEIREERRWSCWIRSLFPIIFCSKIKTVPFYDFEVCIPGKAEELLQIRYGKEWTIPTSKYKGYTV